MATGLQAEQVCKHEVPASRIILAAASGYFKARFTPGFAEGPSNSSYELDVGPGEADAAKAVLRSIYTGKVPEQASVPELICFYKMADRLQTTTVTLIVKALTNLELSDWEWDAVILVGA